ncbi:hypothetical protein [Mycobacteroides abscessus]|uniref:hypothetical protein n=1 Tax=Mycobacteroides abscessus TaxID=36809 RepID=UPI0019D2FCD0|nr:hypothetical protein [Mycobacteroides abscessus]MBN7411756.1 hypothetical protein [Mycobacteroides abscessus subsp. abscessus]
MTGSPEASFHGEIALDIRDSEPDWTPYVAPTAPEAPQHPVPQRWFDEAAKYNGLYR